MGWQNSREKVPSEKKLLAYAKLNLSLQVQTQNSQAKNSQAKNSQAKNSQAKNSQAKNSQAKNSQAKNSQKMPRGENEKLHEIKSSVAFLELHDVLIVEERQKGGLLLEVVDKQAEVSSANIPSGEENIIVRAARALERATKTSQSWKITLHKNIPIGAGLGGGSSDAAAFLLYAQKKIRLEQKKWLDIAKEVGSDVALFMLRGKKTNHLFVQGTGEIISQRETLKVCGVVLLCGKGLSTSEVYRRYSLTASEAKGSKARAQNASQEAAGKITSLKNDLQNNLQNNWQNDLQDAACSLDPSIAERIKALRECEGIFYARMTGSGSACFGLTELGGEENVAEELRSRGFSNVLATRLLATRLLATRLLATRLLATRLLATRLLATKLLATKLLATKLLE